MWYKGGAKRKTKRIIFTYHCRYSIIHPRFYIIMLANESTIAACSAQRIENNLKKYNSRNYIDLLAANLESDETNKSTIVEITSTY